MLLNKKTLGSNCKSSIKCLFVLAFALCSLNTSTIFSTRASEHAGHAETSERIDIILSGLPQSSSDAYQALREAAGKFDGETLEMTNSQKWSIESFRFDALKHLAIKHGVKIKKLDKNWNSVLMRMNDKPKMSNKRMDMIARTMESKASRGMQLMMLPQAPSMEYTMSSGMHKMDKAKTEGKKAPSEISIPLNKETTIKARRTSLHEIKGGYAWHGIVEETGQPVTLLWWKNGRLSGSITYKDHKYAIKSMGGALHAVIDMSPHAMPPDHGTMFPGKLKRESREQDLLVRYGDASMMRPDRKLEEAPVPREEQTVRNFKGLDELIGAKSEEASTVAQYIENDVVTITLLVGYTKAAASLYDNIDMDLISLAVEEANQAFHNSGVDNVRVKLVHSYLTDYDESKGSHFKHVWRFADRGDGYMDEVHGLRDDHNADVGILIVNDPSGCGLATRVKANREEAFAVVHHECAAMSYSLAHEIGHIIGTRHDRSLDTKSRPFKAAHGFVNGMKWRTIMSYKSSCNACPRLPLWSNPKVKVEGVAAGSEQENNARVISEQSARVANFR